jgi:hypothetical protein
MSGSSRACSMRADLEFGWEDQADVDPLVQAQIDDINVKNGTKTVDEIREDRGDDPLTPEQKAEIAGREAKAARHSTRRR